MTLSENTVRTTCATSWKAYLRNASRSATLALKEDHKRH